MKCLLILPLAAALVSLNASARAGEPGLEFVGELRFNNGSTIRLKAAADDRQTSGLIAVRNGRDGSEAAALGRALAADVPLDQVEPAPGPEGYWELQPIHCPKCGKVKGYRQVWMRWCPRCRRYHE